MKNWLTTFSLMTLLAAPMFAQETPAPADEATPAPAATARAEVNVEAPAPAPAQPDINVHVDAPAPAAPAVIEKKSTSESSTTKIVDTIVPAQDNTGMMILVGAVCVLAVAALFFATNKNNQPTA